MNIWFTADHHFGHANIVALRRRPFADVSEMDEALIDHWNEAVRAEDEVWHLGNFAHRCGPNRRAEIFGRLRGAARHLVRGSLDRKHTSKLPWSSVQDYAEIVCGGQAIVLFHYPLQVWHRSRRGTWALHGSSEPGGALGSCAVGVDHWGFRPASFEDVAVRMRTTGDRGSPTCMPGR